MLKISQIKKSRVSEIDFDNIPFGKEFTDHMFSADYIDGEWRNMEIKPLENLNFHPAMLALHYGQSIFEGMKATRHHDGNPLLMRPEMHIRRMNASAQRMCMPDFPEAAFIEALNELVHMEAAWIPKNEGSALYLRPFMFATDEYIGVRASDSYKFLVIALPVGPYYNKPVKLKVERKYVRAAQGGIGEAKTAGNYAASLLPAKLAIQQGFDQVIWMDAKEFKYVQEVGTMNLFFVFKDKVITPSTDGTILKGITRDSLIQIMRAEGIEVEERPLTIDEVFEAYEKGEFVEAFGSGTAAVVANVSLIQDGDKKMVFDESNWALSGKLKNYVNKLRAGRIEDQFGWIHRVKSAVIPA